MNAARLLAWFAVVALAVVALAGYALAITSELRACG